MRTQARSRTLKTTVGELVVAAMEAALEVSQDERKAPRLAGIALNNILQDSRLRVEGFKRGPSKNNLVH